MAIVRREEAVYVKGHGVREAGGGQPVTLQMALRFVTIRSYRLVPDPNASPAAVQIRQGIMQGSAAK